MGERADLAEDARDLATHFQVQLETEPDLEKARLPIEDLVRILRDCADKLDEDSFIMGDY